jgi:hypothetical protein
LATPCSAEAPVVPIKVSTAMNAGIRSIRNPPKMARGYAAFNPRNDAERFCVSLDGIAYRWRRRCLLKKRLIR